MTADPKIRIENIIENAVADANRRAPLHAVLVIPCPADFPKDRETVPVEYLNDAGAKL